MQSIATAIAPACDESRLNSAARPRIISSTPGSTRSGGGQAAPGRHSWPWADAQGRAGAGTGAVHRCPGRYPGERWPPLPSGHAPPSAASGPLTHARSGLCNEPHSTPSRQLDAAAANVRQMAAPGKHADTKFLGSCQASIARSATCVRLPHGGWHLEANVKLLLPPPSTAGETRTGIARWCAAEPPPVAPDGAQRSCIACQAGQLHSSELLAASSCPCTMHLSSDAAAWLAWSSIHRVTRRPRSTTKFCAAAFAFGKAELGAPGRLLCTH